MAETHQRHVATEAPSIEADAPSIDVGLLSQPLSSGDLVFDLLHPELEVGTLAPSLTTSARTTGIDTDDDIALARQDLLPSQAEGIEYLLRIGPAVLSHQHGVLLRRIKVIRLEDPGIQFFATTIRDLDELLTAKAIILQTLGDLLVVLEHTKGA